MNETYSITLGSGGELVVPAAVCRRLGLETGDVLVLQDTPGGLLVMTRDQARACVRDDLAGLDLVGDLLAERRQANPS